ncbi:hypothetical protein TWF730_002749 [Orbilia blumenaviensis]|uniref:Wax synthase domain-containing protein n=1 Tax=Orbilia blumenaviensis TaxID=1796055 RepID=A0AAV9U9P5_9PEZI
MFLNSLQRAFLGLPVLSVAIFALPSSSLIRYALYPLPALLMLQAVLQPPTEKSDVEETYLFGLFISALAFRLFDYLYLQGYDTPKHFFRVRKIGQDKKKQDYPQHIWGRIKWGFLLLVSQRGIGWNFEVPLPATKYPPNKTAFVRQAVFNLLQIYLGVYLTEIGNDFIVGVLRQEISVTEYPWVYDLCKNEAFQIAIIYLGWLMSIISHISILYNLAGIFCIGFGIGGFWTEITSWPKTFGRFGEAWSIRNAWGKAWHQSLRRSLSAPGDRIAEIVFGNPSQLSYSVRLIRRYFLLFSAFAVSGIVHAGGVYFVTVTNPMPSENSTPFSARPAWYVSGYYFILQAVIITLEDLLCWVFRISTDEKEVQRSSIRRLFGLFYTFVWLAWSTTALWINPQHLSFGYQQIGDENLGYVHLLEAISESAAALPLNPWPAIFGGMLPLYNQYFSI